MINFNALAVAVAEIIMLTLVPKIVENDCIKTEKWVQPKITESMMMIINYWLKIFLCYELGNFVINTASFSKRNK